ncbi:uncharacterized protein LOC121377550 [Gigantopelta aegis]|uniref:uncharacterized protein LOC121377550 n=1 Tax=Gigantopelta aegis TaxID=1735272 RepID=UPI001B88DC5C|nr:uncharacterized protein LOC121377550 [Gigantopelta aegis]
MLQDHHKQAMIQNAYLLTMILVMVLLNVLFGINGGHNHDSNMDVLQNKLMTNSKASEHHVRRRSVSNSFNLKIQREGPSITVSNNGRTFHYHGRTIVNGMLQEFFGILPSPASTKPLNDPLSLVSNSENGAHSSSSYTSGRERYSLANPRPDAPNSALSQNILRSKDSSSHDSSDSKTTGYRRNPNARQTPATDLPDAVQLRQTAKINYWNNIGHGRSPAISLSPRIPSYVEYFTAIRNPSRRQDTGQQFSGYAFNIIDEDRLLFPQFGQQHLKAIPGLSMYPYLASEYQGHNRSLEPISEAIISGMHAQYFGIKRHRRV